MTALERELQQLCKYQDNVSIGLEDHDEYMMRRSMRLRDTLIKKILSEYDPKRPSLLLVPAQHVPTQDAQ